MDDYRLYKRTMLALDIVSVSKFIKKAQAWMSGDIISNNEILHGLL